MKSGTDMNATGLESLVYVSSAVRLLDPEEIQYLLERARQRNREYDVTGVLLYTGGNFMQYIEGPKDNLDVIYKIIQEDEQHTGIILISREPIERRQFGEWSMAYHTKDVEGYAGSDEDRKLIEEKLDLDVENPSTARIALHGFWNRRGS